MGLFLEVLFRVEALLGFLVKSLQVRNIRRVREEVREVLVQLLDQHTKLRAPVAHVVHTVNLVAEVLEDAANTIALNCGAQMAHVHIFGDVGA